MKIPESQLGRYDSINDTTVATFTAEFVELVSKPETRNNFLKGFQDFLTFANENQLGPTSSLFLGMPPSINAFFYRLKTQEEFLKKEILTRLDSPEAEIREIFAKQK